MRNAERSNDSRWVAHVVAVLALAVPAAARADRPPRARSECIPIGAQASVGTVTAFSGSAWAESEVCDAPAQRPLACGDELHGGERIVTGADSTLALDMQRTWVQVAADSELRVGLGPSGAPDLMLLRGRVRVVDPDDAGEPSRRLATADLASVGAGDTEATAPPGGASRLCEWARPIAVSRADGSLASARLAPGQCTGPGVAGQAADQLAVSLADARLCRSLDTADRFDPLAVSAGPHPVGFPPALLPPPPPSCQAGTCTSVGKLTVVESPAVFEPPPP